MLVQEKLEVLPGANAKKNMELRFASHIGQDASKSKPMITVETGKKAAKSRLGALHNLG